MAQAHKFRKGKSLFSTTLSVGIGTGTGETIALSSTVGLPTDTEITLTFDRVNADGVATPAKVERITGIIAGSNLTQYTRGVDNTTDQAHSAGCVVEYIWNADDLNDIVDGVLVAHNQDGTHKNNLKLQAPYEEWVSDVDGASITFDMAQANRHKVTLGGNRTLSLTNTHVGQAFVLRLTQDATGSRTVTWWSNISWSNGEAPTLTTTANKTDVFGFIVTGSGTYDGFTLGQNI